MVSAAVVVVVSAAVVVVVSAADVVVVAAVVVVSLTSFSGYQIKIRRKYYIGLIYLSQVRTPEPQIYLGLVVRT